MKKEQKNTPTVQQAYSATQCNDPQTAMLTIIWRQVLMISHTVHKCNKDKAMLDHHEAMFAAVQAEANRQNVTDPLQLVRELETKLQKS